MVTATYICQSRKYLRNDLLRSVNHFIYALTQALIRDYLRIVVEDSFIGLFNAHQSIDIYHQGIMIYIHRV